MKNYKLSDTYKALYDYIIGSLLSDVCNDGRFCMRNNEIPFIIGEKFEEYKARAIKKMSKERLDRHKLASCVCGAIIEARPLMGFNGAIISSNANETFALYAGLSVIKFYMMYSSVYSSDIFLGIEEKVIEYLRNNYRLRFPDFNENICDEQDYKTNLINSLYWTHQQCQITNRTCFCFDIWAYSKIYYHLELYNKPYFENFFQEYIKTLSL